MEKANITKSDVEKIAKLARIEFDDDEKFFRIDFLVYKRHLTS